MMCRFVFDERLGIHLPELSLPWERIPRAERERILHRWEQIRGTIPQRIQGFEHTIMEKQERLNEEDNFSAACRLNTEIAELASRINDLHLWFRVNQDIGEEAPHH